MKYGIKKDGVLLNRKFNSISDARRYTFKRPLTAMYEIVKLEDRL